VGQEDMESAAGALDLHAMTHARFPPSRAKKIKGKNVHTQLDLAQGNNPLPSCVEFRSEPQWNLCLKGETQTWMEKIPTNLTKRKSARTFCHRLPLATRAAKG
jgi:hypothetical protein